MPYVSMLDDYASELANIINDLTHDVQRLRAWASVTTTLTDEERLAVSDEFTDALGTVALGRPLCDQGAVRVRSGHRCHQANMAKEMASWRDEFPNERVLYLNDIEPFCTNWRKYRAFERRVAPIAGPAFKYAAKRLSQRLQPSFLGALPGRDERDGNAYRP